MSSEKMRKSRREKKIKKKGRGDEWQRENESKRQNEKRTNKNICIALSCLHIVLVHLQTCQIGNLGLTAKLPKERIGFY